MSSDQRSPRALSARFTELLGTSLGLAMCYLRLRIITHRDGRTRQARNVPASPRAAGAVQWAIFSPIPWKGTTRGTGGPSCQENSVRLSRYRHSVPLTLLRRLAAALLALPQTSACHSLA